MLGYKTLISSHCEMTVLNVWSTYSSIRK